MLIVHILYIFFVLTKNLSTMKKMAAINVMPLYKTDVCKVSKKNSYLPSV